MVPIRYRFSYYGKISRRHYASSMLTPFDPSTMQDKQLTVIEIINSVREIMNKIRIWEIWQQQCKMCLYTKYSVDS